MSLTTAIATKILTKQTGTNDLGTVTFDMDKHDKTNLGTGTGSNQADLIFADTRTLTASGTEDLDLTGSLVDALGNTLTFAKIKAISIKASSGNTNNVTVSPAAANGFLGPFNAAADLVSIPPNGSFMVTAPVGGWTVTAATADLLTIANSAAGTDVIYDIVIIGTSA